MDSGNSGSLQSSSGGGDDFDAACGGGGADSSSSSPLAALLRHQGFGCASGASALIYGLQDLATPPLSSHWCSTTATTPLPPAGDGVLSSPPCHGGLASASAPAADQTAAAAAPQQQPPAPPPRRSKKRARASRRAPTTVLTTDTSNFRAMVQEFTGIPAPPFAGAGAARSRLDHHLLLPSRSSSAAALPQYLLHPLVHKLHAAYLLPSTSSPAPANAAIIAASAAAPAGAVASGDGYQRHITTAAPPALLGMQDHGGSGGGGSGGGGSSYLSFQFQSALAGQLDGGDDATKYPLFDRGVAPPRSLPDPADFLGLAHGIESPEGARNGDRGDELSGLVGGCKATYSSASPHVLGCNGRDPPAGVSTVTTAAATTAMRTQGVDSWVCSTSE